MFRNKGNKEKFNLNINKEQARKEYEEYLNQPPEVLENLRKCKLFMAVYIPVGAILETIVSGVFFDFKSSIGKLLSFVLCIILGIVIFFVSKRTYYNSKLRIVPLVCLCSGWLIGLLCIQKVLILFLNIVG